MRELGLDDPEALKAEFPNRNDYLHFLAGATFGITLIETAYAKVRQAEAEQV